MKGKIMTAFLVAGLFVSVAVRGGVAQESVRLSGADVAVYNLAGQVEVVRGSGSDVVVEILRGGGDSGQLRVETGEIGGRETLRIIYPDDEIRYGEMGRGSRTQVRVRDDGTFGGDGGGDRVTLRGSGGGLDAHADLRIQVPAGTDLAVYVAVGRIDARDVEGNLTLDTHSGRVSARTIRGNLLVDTGSGSVDVADVVGDVLVDTGSGSVRIEDAEGGTASVDTGSGSVRGRNLAFATFLVDTGSGSVELDGLAAREVNVDTGSGSVELVLLSDVDDLRIDTGSGGITLYVPEDFGAEVELDTGSGGIDLDVPVQASEMERDYVRGIIGDGDGRATLDTGSGGIRIRRR